MWRLLLAWALLGGLPARGQPLRRAPGEAAAAFARRNGPAPAAPLVGEVLETPAWGTRVIIAFYARPEGAAQPEPCVEGYLFVPAGGGRYRRLLIDRYEQEGADAEIASVFFANADRDPARELVVLCRWPQQHYRVSGALYQASFYAAPAAAATRLVPLLAVNKRFPPEFDGSNETGAHPAAYKSAAAIRARLRQLGY